MSMLEEITDKELNTIVHLDWKGLKNWLYHPEEDVFSMDSQGVGGDYVESAPLDYCNDVSAAWPIILEHKINIDHRESIRSGPIASVSGNKEIYSVHQNPLRAAMVCYLLKLTHDRNRKRV